MILWCTTFGKEYLPRPARLRVLPRKSPFRNRRAWSL